MVVTGFPNFPTGRLYPGYRIRRRSEDLQGRVRVRRVAIYPSHDRSGLKRFANFSSFALSACTAGVGALRKCDAVWVYNSPATVGLPSWLTSTCGGPPHLMHVMDLWPDSIALSGLTARRSYLAMAPALRAWCRFTYRQAGAIACISRAVIDELVRRGVPPGKLHYVPVWANESRYYPRPPDRTLAAQLGLTDAKLVLLYAGNLGEAQGLDSLLDGCACLQDLEGFRCVVAGTGTAEARLRERARRLRLSNVSFLGHRPAEDIGQLMAIADLHVVSLGNHHRLAAMTLPSKLAATMASGRAILAAAEGETARVVREAGAGWVVPPGSAEGIEAAVREAMVAGRDWCARLGAAARSYYEEELSVRHGVEAIENLLYHLAQPGVDTSLAA